MEQNKIKMTFGIQEHHIKRINEERARWNQPDKDIPGTPPDAILIEGFWEQLGREFGWSPFTLALHYMRAESRIDNNTGYRSLWDYLHFNHGLTLLESEVGDLVHFVYKFHPKEDTALLAKAERYENCIQGILDYIAECKGSSISMEGRITAIENTLSKALEQSGEKEPVPQVEEKEIKIPVTIALFEFIRDCAENWDHDSDGHKYDTGCRKCDAKSLFKDLKAKKEGIVPPTINTTEPQPQAALLVENKYGYVTIDAKDSKRIAEAEERGCMLEMAMFQAGYQKGKEAASSQHGAVWVKGEPKTRKLYHARFKGHISDDIYDGIIEPVLNPKYWQAIASGVRISITADHIIEYLDEGSGKEDLAATDDIIGFCEWIQENAVAQYEGDHLHSWRIFGPSADGKDYTTAQLWAKYKP